MGTDQPVSRNGALLWLLGCNLIVFCSNICIMVLELTASRLLAHLIGQSLYTWTGVIGVVLAGITIGNYVGGYLSDRYDHLKLLAALFFAAAVTTAASLQINGWMANVRLAAVGAGRRRRHLPAAGSRSGRHFSGRRQPGALPQPSRRFHRR